ncbi:hypothetical protein ACJX0J_028000, partial [Zea mays]
SLIERIHEDGRVAEKTLDLPMYANGVFTFQQYACHVSAHIGLGLMMHGNHQKLFYEVVSPTFFLELDGLDTIETWDAFSWRVNLVKEDWWSSGKKKILAAVGVSGWALARSL